MQKLNFFMTRCAIAQLRNWGAMALFSFGFNVIEYLLVVSICSFFVFVALFSSRSFRSLR